MNKIPKNTPEICGNCAIIGSDCDCNCHTEAIVSGFHEKIESRPLDFITFWDKLRHKIIQIFRLKVARI